MPSSRDLFELSFGRPRNYLNLSPQQQWDIDKSLGILDWDGEGLTEEDHARIKAYYEPYTGSGREKN